MIAKIFQKLGKKTLIRQTHLDIVYWMITLIIDLRYVGFTGA